MKPSKASMVSLTFILIFAIFFHTTPAEPIPPPDLTRCQPALGPDNITTIPCCLPIGNNKIIDFIPPPYTKIRTRPAAHLVDQSYIAKYSKAVSMMRALGPDHPWNHMQQANIHCAYCNGAYNMPGYNVTIQVHGSWLFLPFHRMYMYFYERILGKLIGDDDFAISFWNWDHPDGMMIPQMFTDPNSSLYDQFRNMDHMPPVIVDENFNFDQTEDYGSVNLTDRNLHIMYRQMFYATNATLFMGNKYVAGMQYSPGGGYIEQAPHSTVHSWTGDPRQVCLTYYILVSKFGQLYKPFGCCEIFLFGLAKVAIAI